MNGMNHKWPYCFRRRTGANKQLLLRDRGGYTLTEALVTMLIVVLVTGAMATGIAYAFRQYDESISLSQAKVLQSTLKNALQNELAIVEYIIVDETESGPDQELLALKSKNYVSKSWAWSQFKTINGKIDSDGNPYGEIALGFGDDPTKWKKLISSSSYHGVMGAQVSIVHHAATDDRQEYYTVKMRILNDSARELTYDEFDVAPLNKVHPENMSELEEA